MKTTLLLGMLLALVGTLEAQTATTPRARRVADDVRYLASDALAGRKTGEPGNDSAAAYIARELRRLRLRPAGDSGGYLQHWTAGSSTATREAGVAGRTTENVVAILPGADPRLRGEAIVLGAHFDHLGMGGANSLAPESVAVHNGADDNASGTAAVMELARLLSQARPRPARTIVFAFWSGEEEGTLGSQYYVEHPAVPMDSTYAYLNFDMVGRLRNGRLLISGSLTATEWPALLDSVNATGHFDMHASGTGWGPSDHQQFFRMKRPVLHFFTDLHENYHRPSDDAERINADGIVQVTDFALDVAQRLARRPQPLTFVDAPPPAPPAVASSGRPRPSLGTIPDMADEPGGVRLTGVRTGSPADSAGLRAGDILIGLGTHAIANLQDFQDALMAHGAGDRVEVRFRRGDQTMSVMVTLGGRPN